MKRIIYDTATKEIICICQTEELAHSLAQTISYMRNGNAIYGLFKIRLISHDEMDFDQRKALRNFKKLA